MCIKTLVSFCQFILKLFSKNQILTSIKGRNSLANMRKTTIYNTKVDLVDDNVFTKFGLNRSIRFKDTCPAGSVVEHPLRDREVVCSNPGRAIPKALKMVPVATLPGAQHYKASTGFSSPNKISHN